MTNIVQHIAQFDAASILIIGDIMLDRFCYGSARRISPEAPVPVLLKEKEIEMPGGAGNVFQNLKALNVPVKIISVTGEDISAEKILNLIGKDTVLVQDSARPTTVKTRFVNGQQQLLRYDEEETHDISAGIENEIKDQCNKNLEGVNAIILSDYGKGVLTPKIITYIIETAKNKNIPIIVDPKGVDFSKYKGATLVTPNKKELYEATGLPTETDSDVEIAAKHIISTCGIENVLATRSEKGMSVITNKGATTHITSEKLSVYDVSGAGDTVVAVMASAIGAGLSFEDAAHIANKAGCLVVQKKGTATLSRDELQKEMNK